MDDLSWLSGLLTNFFGYCTVIIPVWILVYLVKKRSLLETHKVPCASALRSLAVGKGLELPTTNDDTKQPEKRELTGKERTIRLLSYFFGLQAAYLTWGVLQERIMAHEYEDAAGNKERFTDSQFLVFINRISALALAMCCILYTRQPNHTAPLYSYGFSSMSNIMSSWCQYEALKYIDFPTQVLAKSCKIIPVMLMGRCVQGRSYQLYEYLTAAMISMGVTIFLLTNPEQREVTTVTTVSGLVLLVMYVTFDSFTSNWQDRLYGEHGMSKMQMMAGVNFWSVLLTTTSLVEQGGIIVGLHFIFTYSTFVYHALLLSVCSAAGQVIIFSTIADFGPVVFIIMMTIRQGFAIILSCLIYGHPVSAVGVLGILLVFVAIFLRIYCSERRKKLALDKQMVVEPVKEVEREPIVALNRAATTESNA